jgi:serine-type D-Ala-D-Ala carboxypeptidase/endopeptidase (penicillin-binding protein 4)
MSIGTLRSSARRRALAGLLGALLGLVAAPAAHAQPAPLVQQLRSLVADSGLGEQVGVAVVDVDSGRPVFQHHAARLMNPASNQKLITAFAALRQLGPEFTMRTAVYGDLEDGRVRGGLALRGYGDPMLRAGDLHELAREARLSGVRTVDRVIVDARYFDDAILPPAFEQQPREVAAFRAPIGAVSLDRNAFLLRVMPGPEAGAPARVELLGAGYFELTNRCTTSAEGPPNVIADQPAAPDSAAARVPPRMRLLVAGTIPLGIRGASYRRRVENPLPWAGYAFAEALRAEGIEVGEEVRVGASPEGAAMLASRQSPPVSQIIHELGKYSDNFVAEMLFKVMGAERRRPGRAEDAVAAARSALEDAGVELGGTEIVNGSGLFDGNRVAPQTLAEMLRVAYLDPTIRHEYVASLAIGGVDGTLRRRLRQLPAPRAVRAKTGTLAGVIALSGYVLGPEPDGVFAFSFLANDVRGVHGPARRLADEIATALAAHLYR